MATETDNFVAHDENDELYDIDPSTMPMSNVKKRSNNKKSMKDRVNNVVSVYIPGDDSERVLLQFNDETDNVNESDTDINQNYQKTLLESIDDNLSYKVEHFGNFSMIFGRKVGQVNTVSINGSKMFLSFENESQIYRLSITDVGLMYQGNWIPKFRDLSLVTKEIRCTDQFVYVSGTLTTIAGETKYIIIKYDYDENIIAFTKKYDFPKFGKFDIDKDGDLLILSEKLDSEEDSKQSQISKLKSGFESRPYYIKMGDDDSQYKPLYVAAHGPDNKAWVNLEKIDRESGKTDYRLMSFRCCTSGNKEELKDRLDVCRWKFANYNLGPIVSLENRLLSINMDQHNLCFIDTDKTTGQPNIKRISAPGSPYLVNLCSDTENNIAYLFTRCSIYKFTFVEQLIAGNTEMYV